MESIHIFISTFVIFWAKCQGLDNEVLALKPNFSLAVKSKDYVDKTLLIKAFIDNLNETCEFISAPRDFGKTLNMQMLKQFLEIQVDENGREIEDKSSTTNFELFKNTKIFKEHPELFKQHFGKYPVLYVDNSELANATCFEDGLQKLLSIFLKSTSEHDYLERGNELWTKFLEKLKSKMNGVNEQEKNQEAFYVASGLKYLSDALNKHFNKTCIVLIDEYDAIVNNILYQENIHYKTLIRMFSFINIPFLNHNFTIIRKLFCTGYIHISDDNMSPVHDLQFTKNHQYTDYFGLTEDEITDILNKHTADANEIEKLKTDLRQYYGYNISFRETPVYKTWSVLNYLQNKKLGSTDALKSYWVKPTFYKPFLRLFYDTEVKMELLDLLFNETVSVYAETTLLLSQIDTLRDVISDPLKIHGTSITTLIFTFLLRKGYLVYTFDYRNRFTGHPQLPNLEVRREVELILLDSVVDQFGFGRDAIHEINSIINGITETNCENTEFKKLFVKFTELFANSRYDAHTDSDCRSTLISLFRYKFQNHLTSELRKKFNRLGVHVVNDNGVSFIVETKLLRKSTKIETKEMRDCSTEATNRIIAEDYVNVIDRSYRERVVYLGVCVGVAPDRGETKDILIGFSFSKKFNPKDNLNSTTTFVQTNCNESGFMAT